MGNNNDDSTTAAISLNTTAFQSQPKTEAAPCLVLILGSTSHMGRQWALQKSVVTMGRLSGSDICLEEGGLSKNHARFTLDADNVFLTDLGATNKTMVNGSVLTPHVPYRLKNNDQIRAGSLLFKFLHKGILSETTEKQRMQSELESARSVQASLLPSQLQARYGTVLIGGRSRSASETSGDWWWHWACGDRAFAFIGDVTGHGAGAALLTGAARSVIATMEDDASVDAERLYSTLCLALEKCAGGKVTMSAFLVEVNLKSGLIRYINASHLPAIALKRGTQGPTAHFSDDNISSPLGSPHPKISVSEMQSEPGLRLVLMTDGLTERNKKSGNAMRDRAFVKMLVEVHVSQAEDQNLFLDSLLKRSDDFAEGAALADDLTVVVLDF